MASLAGGQPSFNATWGGKPQVSHRSTAGQTSGPTAQHRSSRSAGLCPGGRSTGLDFFQQSADGEGPPDVETFEVDTHVARLKKLRFTVCRTATLLQEETRLRKLRRKVAMLTVTYRPGVDWQPGQIRSLIRNIQQWCRDNGFGPVPLLWVGELQVRGAVHYHIAIWLPAGRTLPMPDKRGWWSHGSTNIKWARFAPGYLAKYISKVESKDARFPKGMRLYGVAGVSKDIGDRVRFEKMPAWAKEGGATLSHDMRRAPESGGLVARATGEWRPSPFKALRARGGRVRLRVVIADPVPFTPMEALDAVQR